MQPSLDQLLESYFAGSMTPAEKAALQALLRADPEARRRFWAAANLEASLTAWGRQAAGRVEGLHDSVWSALPTARSKPEQPALARPSAPSPLNWKWCSALAIAASIALAIFHFPPEVPRPPGESLARMTFGDHSGWGAVPGPLAPGTMCAGRYHLRQGRVRFETTRGAVVTVSGPARFTFLAADRIELETGRLTARMNGAGSRLTVTVDGMDVTDGGDGFYYLTGTTAAPGRSHCWDWNDGLHLWRSKDLKSWEHLGLVWSLDRDASWQREFGKAEPGRKAPSGDIMDDKRRAVWAPEIHYVRSRKQWLFVACMNDGSPRKGSFILRSTSGKPEGPYENIPGNATGPIFPNIDGGLFEDEDREVYFVGHNHFIARMKDDLSGLAEPVRQFTESPFDPEPYAEGAYVVKHAGKYHLIQTYWSFTKPDGRFSYLGPQYNHPSRHSYDVVVASADSIYGPYGPRYTAVVEGGHNNFFKDREGRWWSTMFGNPRGASAKTAAFLCRPALVPLTYENGRFRPDASR